MHRRMTRRDMLRTSLLTLAGAPLAAGCAPVRGRAARPRIPVLAPVRVEADRVIRTLAGLRPFRPAGFVVRAERLGDKALIHNYGHGGGGVTLSWGSSELAAELAEQTGHRRFAVVGSGVMGLTTARRLQDRGYDVTIYTRDLPPDTTSNIAGGHWSPTSVFEPSAASPAFRAQFDRAARLAHRWFQNLAGPRYGVRWLDNYVLREGPPRSAHGASSGIGDLFPDAEVFGPGEHPFGTPYVERYVTMMVEPTPFLDALTGDFLLRGGKLVIREFRDPRELLLLEEPGVVNCTGLGSRTLFGDAQLLPIRGQLAVLLPQEEVDYVTIAGWHYMFPRSDGIILGGTYEKGVAEAEVEPEAIQRILAGHQAVFGRMRG